jgi:hypothetical protein
MAYLKYIISIVVLLCITVAYGGDRKSILVNEDGNHETLLDVGECNKGGCVLVESTMEQWDGVEWIYQQIDTSNNGKCNLIRVWKPLVDPTFGTFYTIHSIKTCK